MSSKFNPIIHEEPDGYHMQGVGNWAQKKYRLVGHYCNIFTSGMKNKWNLIYMDLFSASGFAQMRESGQVVRSSALISMSIPNQFDHYIFNDIDGESTQALKSRIERFFPESSYKIYNQDANIIVDTMLAERPVFNNKKGTLTFCFIDPFSINFNFNVIESLAKEQVDILILLAMQMDVRRNLVKYWKPENDRISRFTANPNWREDFKEGGYSDNQFIKFLSDQFDRRLKTLNYITDTKKEIISTSDGLDLYYLSFYSKHPRGIDFFKKISKSGNNQFELF